MFVWPQRLLMVKKDNPRKYNLVDFISINLNLQSFQVSWKPGGDVEIKNPGKKDEGKNG